MQRLRKTDRPPRLSTKRKLKGRDCNAAGRPARRPGIVPDPVTGKNVAAGDRIDSRPAVWIYNTENGHHDVRQVSFLMACWGVALLGTNLLQSVRGPVTLGRSAVVFAPAGIDMNYR